MADQAAGEDVIAISMRRQERMVRCKCDDRLTSTGEK